MSNPSASSSLFSALEKDDLATVEKSIQEGVDPNQFNQTGNAPLHVITSKSFRNPNTFPIIISLIKAKADVNLKNQAGLTPIQVALQSGWQDTVAFLLESCGAKFDEATRSATNVRCPDCKRVLASYEKANYQPINYQFENNKWNGYKVSA